MKEAVGRGLSYSCILREPVYINIYHNMDLNLGNPLLLPSLNFDNHRSKPLPFINTDFQASRQQQGSLQTHSDMSQWRSGMLNSPYRLLKQSKPGSSEHIGILAKQEQIFEEQHIKNKKRVVNNISSQASYESVKNNHEETIAKMKIPKNLLPPQKLETNTAPEILGENLISQQFAGEAAKNTGNQQIIQGYTQKKSSSLNKNQAKASQSQQNSGFDANNNPKIIHIGPKINNRVVPHPTSPPPRQNFILQPRIQSPPPPLPFNSKTNGNNRQPQNPFLFRPHREQPLQHIRNRSIITSSSSHNHRNKVNITYSSPSPSSLKNNKQTNPSKPISKQYQETQSKNLIQQQPTNIKPQVKQFQRQEIIQGKEIPELLNKQSEGENQNQIKHNILTSFPDQQQHKEEIEIQKQKQLQEQEKFIDLNNRPDQQEQPEEQKQQSRSQANKNQHNYLQFYRQTEQPAEQQALEQLSEDSSRQNIQIPTFSQLNEHFENNDNLRINESSSSQSVSKEDSLQIGPYSRSATARNSQKQNRIKSLAEKEQEYRDIKNRSNNFMDYNYLEEVVSEQYDLQPDQEKQPKQVSYKSATDLSLDQVNHKILNVQEEIDQEYLKLEVKRLKNQVNLMKLREKRMQAYIDRLEHEKE